MAKVKPSDLELQVLSVLWEKGPMTAREVREVLPDGKERAYTSVLSVMQVMEKKGLLTYRRKGNAYVFRPKVTQKQALGPMLRGMVSNVFGGRVSSVMQHLLSETAPSVNELEQIRALLDQYEEEKSEPVKKKSRS
jgi:predicted transcriptional regulator